jgi:putative adenylate-forming enzyme
MKWFFKDLETKFFFLFFLLCRYRFRYFTIERIRKYQLRRAREQAAYAAAHSGFFKQWYAGCDLSQPWQLPPVNKKIMMDNLTGYNTVGLTREEILDFCLGIEKTRDFDKRLKGLNVGMSSGTSGNKGVEIVSRTEERYMKAALLARFDHPRKEKINLAFILRVSAPAFSLGIFGHKLTYISQLSTIGEIGSQLEKLNPNIISAPPSMLKIIAKEVEKGTLAVHPKQVVSYAEVLYPDVKDYLRRVFGCMVHQIYKCTEGPIAISCRYGSLHINEDLVAVECLENDGTETLPGEPCKRLIVTDLHKRSQPIIRYELNDIITISPEKCRCGSAFRVISSIQGRADDVFWAKSTRDGSWQYIFPDYISRAVISASEDIDEYQVIQSAPDRVLVRIQLRDTASADRFAGEEVIAGISGVFDAYSCERPLVTIAFEKPQFNPNSSKLIRIQRTFKLDSHDDR